MELTPALVLAVWSAGLAAGGAAICWWRVVGAGYVWLTSATVVLFGTFAAAAGGDAVAWVAVAAAAAAVPASRNRGIVVGLFGLSTVLFGSAVAGDSALIPVVTGAVFMGGVTSEMTLGHWYLVDPRLPRWALQRLTVAGGAGLAAEIVYFGLEGAFAFGTETVLAWSYLALAVMTSLLVAGVWFSLKEPSYTGVMAATGLSYLGTLTAVGVLVVGRLIVWGT